MKNKYIFILFVIITVLIFRNYFFKNLVPFSSNLLLSYYEPWTTYQGQNKIPNKPMGFDNLRILYPLRKLTIDQIKNFEIPLWNPYAFSGNMLLATYQSAVFHPLSFLFFILPQIDAWSIIIILQPILASIFMYLFLKELGMKTKIAFFGSTVFAFSGYFIVWWEENFMLAYSALFLPLILFSTLKLFKKISILPFILLVLGLTFSVLSGGFQTSFYVFVFSIIFTLFLYISSYKEKSKAVLLIISAYIISVFLSGTHLIPNIEAFLYSARGTTDAKFIFDDYLLPLQRLITFISPDFYGNPATYNYFAHRTFYYETALFLGIPSIITAIYALFSFRNQSSVYKFFSFASLVTISLGFSLPTSWFLLYQLKLPFISTMLPTRIFFLSIFSLSIISAFGMELFLKKPQFRKILLILLILWISILSATFFLIFPYRKDIYEIVKHNDFVSLKNLILPAITLFVTSLIMLFFTFTKKWQTQVYSLLLVITLGSLFYFANKYLFFSQKNSVYPNTPVFKKLQEISGVNRIWGYKGGHVESNFMTYYHLFSPEGYDSIYIRRYGELLGAALKKGIYSPQIPRNDAFVVTNDYEKGIEKNLYRKKIITLLGVRYVVEKNSDNIPHENENIFKPIWTDGIFTIYDFLEAFPRVFLADNFILKNSSSDLIKSFFDPNIDLLKTILLENNIDLKKENIPLNGNAEFIKYTPNEISIKTSSNKDALLFLSDNDYPDWNAYIDEEKTLVYRADYAFRSIIVPKGIHNVEFRYEPVSLRLGVISTIIGIISFIGICLFLKKK